MIRWGLLALVPLGIVIMTDPLLRAADKPAADAKSGLVPRKVLFDNPDKAGPKISPDGKHLSYLAPVDGVLNVWVGPIDKPDDAKPITKDKKRGIRSYNWAFTNDRILYTQDADGDENWHVYSTPIDGGETKDLTPEKKVSARLEEVSHKFPAEVIVGLNDRDPRFHDLYRVNVANGEKKLIQKNTEFAGFQLDDDYNVRLGVKFAADGGMVYSQPDGKDGWKDVFKVPSNDTLTTNPHGFDKTGQVLYLTDSRDRNTGALTTLDLRTNKQTVVAEDPKCDAGGVLLHPTEQTIQAVSFTYERTRWVFKDAAVAASFDQLQ
jgi:hypothetical protein